MQEIPGDHPSTRQHDYGRNYPPGQPWQPPQYDLPEGAQGLLPPPATPPQFRSQPHHYAAPDHVSRQPPTSTQPAAAPRRLPPFPAHLVRFPWNALPRSRRRRGTSLGRIFYLGRHPVALLIEACLTAFVLEVIVAWVVFVVGAWMMWAMLVTMAWLVQVAAAALGVTLTSSHS